MLYPGIFLIVIGVAVQIAIAHGPIVVSGIGFDIHTMLYAGSAVILGVQLVLFSALARAIGVLKNVLPMRPTFARFLSVFTLERGIFLGSLLAALGLGLAVYSVTTWAQAHLATLDPTVVMRVAIPSVTLILTGAEIIFSSFLLKFIDVQAPTIDP